MKFQRTLSSNSFGCPLQEEDDIDINDKKHGSDDEMNYN